ncbi:MAG: hypothetical protein PVF54_03255, partial [Anaerolineae bacterium]
FCARLDDSGARLSVANMMYGMAKIHVAQETLGLSPTATSFAAPDSTVTRNTNRWKSGSAMVAGLPGEMEENR